MSSSPLSCLLALFFLWAFSGSVSQGLLMDSSQAGGVLSSLSHRWQDRHSGHVYCEAFITCFTRPPRSGPSAVFKRPPGRKWCTKQSRKSGQMACQRQQPSKTQAVKHWRCMQTFSRLASATFFFFFTRRCKSTQLRLWGKKKTFGKWVFFEWTDGSWS